MEKLHLENIHLIQSLLTEKEAAQTALLSKSWYSAWSTRPSLSFDLSNFLKRKDEFSEFTKKTMQRYHDLNIKIHTFELKLQNPNLKAEDLSLAKELIIKAMALGAHNLYISLYDHCCTNVPFVLPGSVLECKALARLYLSGLTLNVPPPEDETTYWKLKSLDLLDVVAAGGDLFTGLLSRCPSIERLTLHIKRMGMDGFEELRLGKLEYLSLSRFELGLLSSRESWDRFPCLKELVILNPVPDDGTDVRILSRSLERITLRLDMRNWNVEFDVPNLAKFEFWGCPSSSLDFKAGPIREWESGVHFTCFDVTPSWFSRSKRLLGMLQGSRVSLSIDVKKPLENEEEISGGCDGFRPLVETLRLEGREVNSVFLDNLLRMCRPKSIIQCHDWRGPTKKEELVEAEEVTNVKLLEERFGKCWCAWSTRIEYEILYYVTCQLRWNLDQPAP